MWFSLTYRGATQWALIFFFFPPLLIKPTADTVWVEHMADCTLEFTDLIRGRKGFDADGAFFSFFGVFSNFLVHSPIFHNTVQIQTSRLRGDFNNLVWIVWIDFSRFTAAFITPAHRHDANPHTQNVTDNISYQDKIFFCYQFQYVSTNEKCEQDNIYQIQIQLYSQCAFFAAAAAGK